MHQPDAADTEGLHLVGQLHVDRVGAELGATEITPRDFQPACEGVTNFSGAKMPTGIWYSPGVKANVIFFEKEEGWSKAWTDTL